MDFRPSIPASTIAELLQIGSSLVAAGKIAPLGVVVGAGIPAFFTTAHKEIGLATECWNKATDALFSPRGDIQSLGNGPQTLLDVSRAILDVPLAAGHILTAANQLKTGTGLATTLPSLASSAGLSIK